MSKYNMEVRRSSLPFQKNTLSVTAGYSFTLKAPILQNKLEKNTSLSHHFLKNDCLRINLYIFLCLLNMTLTLVDFHWHLILISFHFCRSRMMQTQNKNSLKLQMTRAVRRRQNTSNSKS